MKFRSWSPGPLQHGAPSEISGQTNKIDWRSLRSSYFLSSDLKTDSKKSSCRLAYPSGSMMVTRSECIGWKQVRFRTFSVRFRTSQCTRKSMTPRRSKYQGLLGSAVSSCCGSKNNEISMMKSYEQCWSYSSDSLNIISPFLRQSQNLQQSLSHSLSGLFATSPASQMCLAPECKVWHLLLTNPNLGWKGLREILRACECVCVCVCARACLHLYIYII